MSTDHADHDEDGVADTGVLDDCINQATEEIDLYVATRYERSDLADSNLVNRWATLFAAYFLTTRRGNPTPNSWEIEFQRIIELLQDVNDGKKKIPGIPLRADMRPSMSNLTIDRRYRRSTVRVTPTNSTDAPTTLTQDKALELPALLD